MSMTREEYNAKSADVLAELSQESPDTGKITGFLDELRDGFNDEVSRAETAERSRDELTEKNRSLQEANMSLFLKLGEPRGENRDKAAGFDTSQSRDKMEFSSLFNEKGELI